MEGSKHADFSTLLAKGIINNYNAKRFINTGITLNIR